jgi:hypothetical protein
MALFRRTAPGELLDDPALDAARRDARQGRFEAGRVLLAETRDDFDLRSYRNRLLADAAIKQLDALTAFSGQRPDDPDLAVWLGEARINHAWEIRGASLAKYVKRSAFEDFWGVLAGAAEPLLRATDLLPDDPTPWNRLQWHGLGMQRQRADLDELWAELSRRGPHYYTGYSSRVQVLCAKWQGSNQEVLDFARTAAAAAGPGDPFAALPIVAHFEGAADRGEITTHFRATETRAELEKLCDVFCAGQASGWPGMEAHHLFGAAFYLAGDTSRARHHLSQVDSRRIPRTWPWARLSVRPGKLYRRVRTELGLPRKAAVGR